MITLDRESILKTMLIPIRLPKKLFFIFMGIDLNHYYIIVELITKRNNRLLSANTWVGLGLSHRMSVWLQKKSSYNTHPMTHSIHHSPAVLQTSLWKKINRKAKGFIEMFCIFSPSENWNFSNQFIDVFLCPKMII